MATTLELDQGMGGTGFVGLPTTALHTLCAALYRDLGGNAAAYLQEAGHGAGLYQRFQHWCRQNHTIEPEGLSANAFHHMASGFFTAHGWGTMTFASLGGVATFDSTDWSEANPARPMEYPACYLTAGMLGDFFSQLSGLPVVAMEVECRSAGSERCRFLIGNAETIQRVYDGIAAGVGYETTLGAREG